MSDRIQTMYSQPVLYESIGFDDITKMMEYGKLIGKNYEGVEVLGQGKSKLNLHDAHNTIFGETIEARKARRDKFFPDPLPVKPVAPNPLSTTFGFMINIGTSLSDPFKVTDHNITIPNISLLKPTSKNIILQTTTMLDNGSYHDQLTSNIRWYNFEGDILKISFTTFRANNEGWGLHVKVHLLVIIFEKDIL